MRLIGHLPTEPDARRFVDYLLTQRVAAHAEEGNNGAWQIWVENDDHLDAGTAELRQFQARPADPRYDAADTAKVIRKQAEKAAERRQQNYRDVRTTMFAAPTGATPVTLIMIGIAVAIYVITTFGGGARRDNDEARQIGVGDRVKFALLFDDPLRQERDIARGQTAGTFAENSRLAIFNSVLRGEVWRFVTPIFLHGGILHILFNMMWMLDLGRRIEPVKGSGKFVAIILATAVISCTAEAVWIAVSPFNAEHYNLFLGMSGVVSGLFGYAWACGRYRPYENVGVSAHETGYMLVWLIICSIGFIGFIANAAHWGGLVAGFVIGAWPTWMRKLKS